MAEPLSIARVVRAFALTGILSIGGGRAAFFYDALVTRRRWMRAEEFLQDFTLAQLLPGPRSPTSRSRSATASPASAAPSVACSR